MVGQGVLRECVLDPGVERVLAVTRSRIGPPPEKVTELVHGDFFDFASIGVALRGYDACFFCLGVSSAGMGEAEYTRLTYDLTMAAAEAVLGASPGISFVYVTGNGTDSTERGRWMWARVKGRTENALLRLPFRSAFMFRPGMIEALDGIHPRANLARMLYALIGPFTPLLQAVAGKYIVTTGEVGRAMIAVVRSGYPKRVLEIEDIARAAAERG